MTANFELFIHITMYATVHPSPVSFSRRRILKDKGKTKGLLINQRRRTPDCSSVCCWHVAKDKKADPVGHLAAGGLPIGDISKPRNRPNPTLGRGEAEAVNAQLCLILGRDESLSSAMRRGASAPFLSEG